MRSIVLDASAALAWLLPSQATPLANALLSQANQMDFQAPSIFDWEVRNALLTFERRRGLTAKDYDDALLFHVDLNVKLHAPAMVMSELGMLARMKRLSLFDASYLALALDQGWPLASRDDALLMAASEAGVECFDMR